MESMAEERFKKLRPHLMQGVGASPSDVDLDHQKTIEILRNNKEVLKGYLGFARLFVSPEVKFKSNSVQLCLKFIPDSMANIKLERLDFDLGLLFSSQEFEVTLTDDLGQIFSLKPTVMLKNKTHLNMNFHQLAVEDCFDIPVSRAERFVNHRFVAFKARDQDKQLDTEYLRVFLTEHNVVTVRHSKIPAINQFKGRYRSARLE